MNQNAAAPVAKTAGGSAIDAGATTKATARLVALRAEVRVLLLENDCGRVVLVGKAVDELEDIVEVIDQMIGLQQLFEAWCHSVPQADEIFK